MDSWTSKGNKAIHRKMESKYLVKIIIIIIIIIINVGLCRDNGTQRGFSSLGPVEFLPPHLDCVFCRVL